MGAPVDQFLSRGFVVLRREIDPRPLAKEIDLVSVDAFPGDRGPRSLRQGGGTVTFRYVPMMCERTPVSLAMIDRFSVVAAELLGRRTLPGRAKATWYHGDTGWHRESEHGLASLACVCYLEALSAANGALRVVPGSHADTSLPLPGTASSGFQAGEAVETEPGDVIIFDEHLIHGSTHGAVRRQWRIDFVIDPVDAHESSAVAGWFHQSIPDEQRDPGYDAKRYPSYGPYWQSLDRPWVPRLRELGVYPRDGQ